MQQNAPLTHCAQYANSSSLTKYLKGLIEYHNRWSRSKAYFKHIFTSKIRWGPTPRANTWTGGFYPQKGRNHVPTIRNLKISQQKNVFRPTQPWIRVYIGTLTVASVFRYARVQVPSAPELRHFMGLICHKKLDLGLCGWVYFYVYLCL